MERLQRLQQLEAEAADWRDQAMAQRSCGEQLRQALQRQEGQAEKAAERHAALQEEAIALRLRGQQLHEEQDFWAW